MHAGASSLRPALPMNIFSRFFPAGRKGLRMTEGLFPMDDAQFSAPPRVRRSFPPCYAHPGNIRACSPPIRKDGNFRFSAGPQPGTSVAELRTTALFLSSPPSRKAAENAERAASPSGGPDGRLFVQNSCNTLKTMKNNTMRTSCSGKGLLPASFRNNAAFHGTTGLRNSTGNAMYPMENIDQFKVTNKNAHIVFTKPTKACANRENTRRSYAAHASMSFPFLFLLLISQVKTVGYVR